MSKDSVKTLIPFPLLRATTLLFFSLAALALLLAAFDARQILGLNRWAKPGKFALSTGIYCLTIGWMLSVVPGSRRMPIRLSRIIALVMIVEIFAIFLQAARGVTSHFNTATLFDGAVFTLMGLLILVNTVCMVVTVSLFFVRPVELSPALLWGVRLGLILSTLGSLQGLLMVGRLGHTVGAPDGGPGLPILSWSTRHGDLRIAHGLGLHALQAVPFVGFLASRAYPWLGGGHAVCRYLSGNRGGVTLARA
ncbi:MAG: hypothetical protein ABIZ80_22675 [Bryobacteraceae bacterium]